MDITVLSIVGSTFVISVILIIGFKKIFDNLLDTQKKQKEIEQSLCDFLSSNNESLTRDIEKSLKDIKSHLNNKLEMLGESFKVTNENQLNHVNKLSILLKEKYENLSREHLVNSEKVIEYLEVIKKINNDNDLKTQNTFSKLNLEFIEALGENADKTITIFKEEIHKSFEKSIKEIVSNSERIKKDLDENTSTINSKLDKSLKIQDKNLLTVKSKIDNSFLSIVSLVNNLRLDNLINLSNEISKYKEGVYEDEHFLQEVGHCKIIKLTDKNSGEVTNVYYDEDGEKSHTETFDNDTLKYNMKYENGKLKRGVELNSDGEVLFEYLYDDAEEVTKKIEYIYEENGKYQDKKETNY